MRVSRARACKRFQKPAKRGVISFGFDFLQLFADGYAKCDLRNVASQN